MTPVVKWLAAFLLAAASLTAAAADRYYRYVNDEGVTVLDSRIPPRYVKKGYEVVTASGQVLQVVPPTPSDEELEKLAAQREQEAKMAEWDEYLLRRYSSVGDIESARERKLADFDASMSILRGNANGVEAQIHDLQARAADQERAGRAVPEVLLENLAVLQAQLEKVQQQLELRLLEKRELEKRFDSEIRRFSQIRPPKE
ncbi:DUF4124 domain-containing protein [Proteobacteria bacterium 005FR1]|nr:DUF4124 domain-containing protein [Proteobacteria bacterium 005FR1]